jgi:hypothetical protein
MAQRSSEKPGLACARIPSLVLWIVVSRVCLDCSVLAWTNSPADAVGDSYGYFASRERGGAHRVAAKAFAQWDTKSDQPTFNWRVP